MKIGILRIGQTDSYVVSRVQEALNTIFPRTTCTLIAQTLQIPEAALNKIDSNTTQASY